MLVSGFELSTVTQATLATLNSWLEGGSRRGLELVSGRQREGGASELNDFYVTFDKVHNSLHE